MHYGWWVVVGGFTTQFILIITMQSLPICLSMIEVTLGVTHAQAGTIVSVFGLCYAGFSVLWGYWADKIGVRLTITLAGLVSSLALIIFGFKVNSLVSAVILYAIVGFGAAGIYSATVPKLIGAWFHPSKRGKAMSFITPGGAISGIILGLVIPILAGKYSWKTTFVILGFVALSVTLLILSVVRNSPAEKGLTPNGSPEGTSIETSKPPQSANDKDKKLFAIVLKQKVTWQLCLMFIFFEFAYMTTIAFLSVSVISAGFSVTQAGLAVSIYNLASLLAMFVWGPLSDKIERKIVLFIACSFWVAAAVILILVWGNGLTLMYVMFFLMGLGMGTTPVILAMFSDYYEPAYRGTGNGIISSSALIGRFFGPIIAGVIADVTGAITSVFAFAGVTMLICAIITLTLPNLKRVNPKEVQSIL